ncbi:uncharacterized protein LOC129909026 [Episyrphus balteatus]|uniref:uncharacterized protein LOC129909026 n=1 Tax=Episyrphus balteatus TaxID=286459 RepID=UPI002486C81B|nr:uncharacterized protein LOC129909026 [Episyrphus balteatus]
MFLRPRLANIARSYCNKASAPATGINANVEGLSSRCVKPATEPVGPGASANGEYKVPEYFCFSRVSYFEAEVEMAKYRCPQPKANRKQ